jgi:DNA-binding NarL/FixJ family response regulator
MATNYHRHTGPAATQPPATGLTRAASEISRQGSQTTKTTTNATTNGGRRLRVLIADHDGLARSMIHTALADHHQIAIVLTAPDGHQALQLARYYNPNITIIDTTLPRPGALHLIHQLKIHTPQTTILTTAITNHQSALAALHAGAHGHITKDTDPRQLPALILKAAQGQPIIPQTLIKPLLKQFQELPHTGWRPLHSRLTTREWEIIELLDQGATTQQIADRFVLSTTTIYSHIKNLHKKLNVHTRQEAIDAAKQLRKQETNPQAGLGRSPNHSQVSLTN